MDLISWNDFTKLDIRCGTITEVLEFPEAKKPAYKLSIDFGPVVGIKKCSAQITSIYTREELTGIQVIAVVNFPPKKIAGFNSECLVLGVYTESNDVVLLQPQKKISNGLKIG